MMVKYTNVIWMLGELHIEMTWLGVLGDWLDGGSWTELYDMSKISTSGRVDSFLKGSIVKRSRYSHQVTLATLILLSKQAFEAQSTFDNYDEWRAFNEKESVSTKYWFTVIDMELILFMFVKSLRESNFDLFIRCIEQMMPWMHSLDHVNYARWMSVFLGDMKALPSTNKEIYNEFCKGNFTVTW